MCFVCLFLKLDWVYSFCSLWILLLYFFEYVFLFVICYFVFLIYHFMLWIYYHYLFCMLAYCLLDYLRFRLTIIFHMFHILFFIIRSSHFLNMFCCILFDIGCYFIILCFFMWYEVICFCLKIHEIISYNII